MRRAIGIGVLGAATGLGWALLEAQAYTVRRVTVPVLPAGAPDVRVLHISDLHLLPSQRRKIEWVRALAGLRPDLVVNTGDNMAHQNSMPAVLEALAPLLKVPGVFVMGSNDYYEPVLRNPARYLRDDPRNPNAPKAPSLPARALGQAFVSAGWADLTNTRAQVRAGGVTFSFVGVDDPHLERDRFPSPTGDGGAHLDNGSALGRGAPRQNEPALHVGVSHAPYVRVLDAMRDDGCGLILAGHTHGGQLCVPGYGALVTNCDLDTGRASGLHGWPGARPDVDGGASGSTWLHVSAGLGTSPFTPVRFACRPEATLLTLTSAD
ncbi:metallophosphoesterase [Occultella glacieicola]|uniref:Metallophosphoesterase n=1 Tax=Occultella glacieicola TaxID=2518684 RepID=A0ABY2DZB6_9MICO|nr:metallophosphoesterase [Occultella glacieicola]TDE89240.1 metallophosphoesterase [Occultella glacieicola]